MPRPMIFLLLLQCCLVVAGRPSLAQNGTKAASTAASSKLLVAIGQKNLPLVRSLLQAGANANAQNEDQEIALDLTAAAGSLEICTELIAHGAAVNGKPEQASLYGPPLLFGVGARSDAVVALLLQKGADPNLADIGGKTPLIVAAATNLKSIVAQLLEPRTPKTGMNTLLRAGPLQWAASNNAVDTLTLLLDRKADANDRDADGKTPLMFAAESGALEAVQLLIKRGANVNARDHVGKTALQHTAGARAASITALLKAAGGTVHEAEPDRGCAFRRFAGSSRIARQRHRRERGRRRWPDSAVLCSGTARYHHPSGAAG